MTSRARRRNWRNPIKTARMGPVIKVANCCTDYGCIRCCLNTEMPLCDSDILRIAGLGFRDFLITKRSGVRLLKNSMGRCVFHDGRRCTIYKDRPEGCRLYPFVFDLDEAKVVMDAHCPHRDKFQITPRISFQVIKLIRKLDAQRTPTVRSRVTD